jgi:hypothetical protein
MAKIRRSRGEYDRICQAARDRLKLKKIATKELFRMNGEDAMRLEQHQLLTTCSMCTVENAVVVVIVEAAASTQLADVQCAARDAPVAAVMVHM